MGKVNSFLASFSFGRNSFEKLVCSAIHNLEELSKVASMLSIITGWTLLQAQFESVCTKAYNYKPSSAFIRPYWSSNSRRDSQNKLDHNQFGHYPISTYLYINEQNNIFWKLEGWFTLYKMKRFVMISRKENLRVIQSNLDGDSTF